MILITGATGLVGTHTALALTQQGKRVRLFHRKNSDRALLEKVFRFYTPDPKPQLALIEWVEGDILDVYALEEAMENVQHVYHCAAIVSFLPCDRDHMLRTNIEGTANVVNAALEKGVRKLCHLSSVAALGKKESGVKGLIDEDVHWKSSPSNSWYAVSKYSSEREAWRGTEEGLDTIIVNPSFVLGPGLETRSSAALFGTAKQGLRWYTEGITGYVDVRDVTAAMIALMESEIKNERFVLNAENLSFRTVIDLMNESFGKPKASRELTPLLAGLAWRAEKIAAAFSGRAPRISKETMRAAQEKNLFGGKKIESAIPGYRYREVASSIKEFSAFYKASQVVGA